MSYAICAEHYNWNEVLVYSDWEWYAVLGFKYLISKELARQRLDHWIKELCQPARLEANYLAVFNCAPSSLQWHVLLCGNGMKGRTLLHLYPDEWEKTWIWMEGHSRTAWLEAEIEDLLDCNCETRRSIEMNMALRNSEQRLFIVSDEGLLKVTGNPSN